MEKNNKKKNNIILILFNIPNKKILKIIIKKILNKKLSCCININKYIKSYYYWNNKLQKKNEIKITIKTFNYLEKKIISIIKKIHPYKIPEIITLNIKKINKKYFNWMKKEIIKNKIKPR